MGRFLFLAVMEGKGDGERKKGRKEGRKKGDADADGFSWHR